MVFNISGGGPKTNGLFVWVFSDEAPWNRSWDDIFFTKSNEYEFPQKKIAMLGLFIQVVHDFVCGLAR